MATEFDLTKFDDVFLGILQHLGKIEPFLEAVFFFLARRTDFYQLMHNRDDKMGFPPGVAEKIVQRIFKKYQTLVLGKASDKQPHERKAAKSMKAIEESAAAKKSAKITEIPEPVQTVEIKTSVSEESESREEQKGGKPSDRETSDAGSSEAEMGVDQQTSKESKSDEKVNKKDLDKPKPSQDPDSFNGAVTDKYSWAQTHTDVDVKVLLPKFVKKSRDIEVQIKPDKLFIALRNEPPPDSGLSSRVLIDGKLTHHIRYEESLWSLVSGECLQIHLEKTSELYWTALLEGEPEIDKTKLDTTRDICEFDQQTQTDFQKVMYDHRQKLQGKPTSDEQKTHDILKQAWDAEGSPFKGTPFDPSRVNITGGSGGML